VFGGAVKANAIVGGGMVKANAHSLKEKVQNK